MQPVKTIKAGTYNTNPQRDAARLNIPRGLVPTLAQKKQDEQNRFWAGIADGAGTWLGDVTIPAAGLIGGALLGSPQAGLAIGEGLGEGIKGGLQGLGDSMTEEERRRNALQNAYASMLPSMRRR